MFRNCDIGIYVQRADSLTATAEIDNCTIEDNDIGIKAYQTLDVTVESSVIDGNTTDGIYCLDDAHIQIRENTITGSAVGLYCYDDSRPVIGADKITGHTTAVKADDYADPDIGHQYPGSGESSGYNSIHNNTYHVVNLTQGGGAPTIMAENNYWKGSPPTCYPRLGKIVGSVDCAPALCSDPNSSSPYVIPALTPHLPAVYEMSRKTIQILLIL